MENNGLSLADIASVTKDHDGAFGSDGLWIFALLILLFGGNGGFGFGNNNGLAETDLNLLNAIQNGQRDISSDVQRTAYENMVGEHLKPNGDYVHIKGTLISYNEGRSLKVYVMAEHLEEMANLAYMNKVNLDGTVCSIPRYKVLSSGKEITHITLGTPKSYYFPIIIWDEQALDASHLEFGDKINVVGRIQSRTYVKDKAIHITYEVSTERITEF